MSDFQDQRKAQMARGGLIGGDALGGILVQTGIGAQTPIVTRQQLIDTSLKLQEALSLITQALGRCR